jgi:hypothetical protein
VRKRNGCAIVSDDQVIAVSVAATGAPPLTEPVQRRRDLAPARLGGVAFSLFATLSTLC